MPRLTASLLALLLTVPLALAGCGDDGQTTPTPSAGAGRAAATVRVDDLKYTPARVTVEAGETVAWEFADGSIPHNVKGEFGLSPTVAKGRWDHTFEERGRFPYLCTIHPYMKGTVTVR